ncbi:MAG: DUF4147 domain-containing protein [Myxococcota bacterium]|nr:DUF4147 domain-containing protein [Myxococcota bacterium]
MSPAPTRRAELEAIFAEALAAVDGERCVLDALGEGPGPEIAGRPLPSGGRVALFAAGKAAVAMARACEERLGERIASGLVITKEGHGAPLERCLVREAGHPVPDARSERAGREALAFVGRTGPGDVLCVLLSGGASSLLACPSEGLTLGDLADTTKLLLGSGADIEELNTVRKHLSRVAGGQLGRSARAERIEVLAISDVPGDRLDVIASGPFAPDPSCFADALGVLDRRGLVAAVPEAVRRHLEAGARGQRDETPGPDDASLARVRTTVVAGNRRALEAAREATLRRGLHPRVVAEPLAGEARDEGRRLATLGRALASGAPGCLLAGGETVVTVRGSGRGGRSQELALAAALELEGGAPVALLAAGTDGTDGPTDAAGAYADEGTASRGRRAGVDPRAALDANDSHTFFAAEGGLFVTGPTGTNVMDLVLVRTGSPEAG